MLNYLRPPRLSPYSDEHDRQSRRKVGLFVCACYYHVWSQVALTDRPLIEALENHIEGTAAWQNVEEAYWEGIRQHRRIQRAKDERVGNVCFVSYFTPAEYLSNTIRLVNEAARLTEKRNVPETQQAERRVQAQLIRDIFGNPFRPVALTPAWVNPPAKQLTHTIYDDRAFDRLPILADALEEAGCDNADILSHCRGPGPHVRGCWVVDLILGKS